MISSDNAISIAKHCAEINNWQWSAHAISVKAKMLNGDPCWLVYVEEPLSDNYYENFGSRFSTTFFISMVTGHWIGYRTERATVFFANVNDPWVGGVKEKWRLKGANWPEDNNNES